MNTETEASIFTKIINREIPKNIIFEDDIVICFLSNEPIRPGHSLVIPKKPFVNLFDGDPDILAHMIIVAQKIAQAILKSGLGDGVNLSMNNGVSAGQEVFHAHIHVIPRAENDHVFSPLEPKFYGLGEEDMVVENLRTVL